MSVLLGISFDSVAAPTISLKAAPPEPAAAEPAPAGWGFGWYPGAEQVGQVMKDPTAGAEDNAERAPREWEQLGSTVFICHFRGPARDRSHSDAQPFLRNYSGRSWIVAHSGTLLGDWRNHLPMEPPSAFEPVGRTDTERLFCWLLNRLQDAGARTLADFGWERLRGELLRINDLGPLNLLLTDGQSLAVYHDGRESQPLYWSRRTPPHPQLPIKNSVITLNLESHHANRTFLAFSTEPLTEEVWVEMAPSQLLIARRGQVAWDSLNVWDRPDRVQRHRILAPLPAGWESTRGGLHVTPPDAAESPDTPEEVDEWRMHWRRSAAPASADAHQRALTVLHETVYRYERPVEASNHVLRLQPVHDAGQTVERFDLWISVDGQVHRFEDVFGNQTLELAVTQPFSRFAVRAESIVRVDPVPALDDLAPYRREVIPLVWMPWQRQMMLAYLLPPELPESQLTELSDFAQSFAERNEFNLRDMLLDMNRTIFHDFEYLPGSTTLETTPYDVFSSRKGVCQDFANLLICMARLMNIPSRYRVGYIDTFATPDNPAQSEASHAWAELYLPGAGWVGFDPTNGKLAGSEHVRVACGRNYRDATPTMGTLFKGGGGGETLNVTVKVESEGDSR